MVKFFFIYIFSVFVSSVSQVLLKMDADRKYNNIIEEYLNPKALFSYALFFASSVITIFAYKGVPLSLGPVIESCGYAFVGTLSYIYLKEKMTKKKIAGIILIVIGVVISVL